MAQSPLAFAHFLVFVVCGLISLTACAIGVFSFLMQDRVAMAQTYEKQAHYYLDQLKTKDHQSQSYEVKLVDFAKQNLQKSLKLEPDNQRAWANLAHLYQSERQEDLKLQALSLSRAFTKQISIPYDQNNEVDVSIVQFKQTHPKDKTWQNLSMLDKDLMPKGLSLRTYKIAHAKSISGNTFTLLSYPEFVRVE